MKIKERHDLLKKNIRTNLIHVNSVQMKEEETTDFYHRKNQQNSTCMLFMLVFLKLRKISISLFLKTYRFKRCYFNLNLNKIE